MRVNADFWRIFIIPIGAVFTLCFVIVEPAEASVAGNWEGTVTEGGTSYKVSVTVDEGAWSGRIVYEHYPCGGNLVLSHSVNGRYIFIERLTFGQDLCQDGLYLRITPQSGDTIYLEERVNGESVVYGTLYRSNNAVDLNAYNNQGTSQGGGSASSGSNSFNGYSCATTKVDEGSYNTAENCGPFGNLNCSRGTTFWERHRYDCSKGGQSRQFFCEDFSDTSGFMPRRWQECECTPDDYYAVDSPSKCLN